MGLKPKLKRQLQDKCRSRASNWTEEDKVSSLSKPSKPKPQESTESRAKLRKKLRARQLKALSRKKSCPVPDASCKPSSSMSETRAETSEDYGPTQPKNIHKNSGEFSAHYHP